ncbi:hypothetical protein FRB94_007906 [Tulasnella sp. JGI-2019a]|nr:hypothetical protein FRB93_007323 [Tulasnella sp. JGI-2019a]KAG8996977.1 hypothetical protein FRB94_007906 [Tulasnella sp. JGI-2019a]KAG9027913.1 hypothetical protein FRB95_007075 [Tulasnella sp. JGI-2019a]
MSEKELNGKRSWAKGLVKIFKGSGSSSMVDAPPAYGSGENIVEGSNVQPLCNRSLSTSPARIMGVNEFGQVLGYISPASPSASWFNFQPAENALVLDVPMIDSKEGSPSLQEEKPEVFRLRMQNPMEAAAAGNFRFLGIHLHLPLSTNEQWMLGACDEGKSGPIFKDRANMFRSAANEVTEGKGSVGNPASSIVWSIHSIEGGSEELRLSWLDKDGALVPLRGTSEQAPKGNGEPHNFWARRKSYAGECAVPIRLIIERCSGC